MTQNDINKQAAKVQTLTETVNALTAQASVKPSTANLESLRRAATVLEAEYNRFVAMRMASR